MYETTGKIDRSVLEKIQKCRKSPVQKVALWAVLILGVVYLFIAASQKDTFGIVMAAIMAFLGFRAVWIRPEKWMKIQEEALAANNTDALEFTTSYAEDCVNIWCRTSGWKGTLAYSNFTKGVETDDLLVLFTFKGEYVVTWKNQLTPARQKDLKKLLTKKFSGRKLFKRFKWISYVTKA